MFFLLKKIIALLLMPETISLIIILLGLSYLWLTKKKFKGKVLVTFGVALLILFSSSYFSKSIVEKLEMVYPKFSEQTYQNNKNINYIVVLGGGTKSSNKIPLSSTLSEKSLNRLTKGILLHKKYYPNAKLILSGGSPYGYKSEAEVMKEIALSMGIKDDNIILESKSKDTESEAILINPIVKKENFILVTSAVHMPRSVMLFKKYGMNPIPAPTAFTSQSDITSPATFFPTPGSLMQTTLAFHEYIGIYWIKAKKLFGK